MKRTNTWQDAYNTGTAIVDLGDGIHVPLPLDGIFPGEPGPPGAGVPEGGAAGQVVRKNSSGTATYWETPNRQMVGLGDVDNTPDSDKPVSDPQRRALAAKADLVEGKLVLGQVPTLPKSRVGLGDVDNTPDTEKPVSTAQAKALAAKADLVYGKIPAAQLPETVVIGDSTVAPVIDAPVTGAAIDARINTQVAPQVQKITADFIAGDRAVADAAAAAVDANPRIVELSATDVKQAKRLTEVESLTPALKNTDEQWAQVITEDRAGRVSLAVRPDGTVYAAIPEVQAMAGVIAQASSNTARLASVESSAPQLKATDETWSQILAEDKAGNVALGIRPNGTIAGGGLPEVTGYDIIVLGGQSDMSGSAKPFGTDVFPPHPRVLQFPAARWPESGRIIPAVEPLLGQGPLTSAKGGGPGLMFARLWAETHPDRIVVLVPAACTATGFNTTAKLTPDPGMAASVGCWQLNKTDEPVNLGRGMVDQAMAAKAAAVVAAGAGKTANVVAFLWSQGLSDGSLTQEQYGTYFDDLASGLRSALSQPDLPVIVGQMSPQGIAGSISAHKIDKAHMDTPRRLTRAAFAYSFKNLTNSPTDDHLSPRGQHKYAESMFAAYGRAVLNVPGFSPIGVEDLSAKRVGSNVHVKWTASASRVTAYVVDYSVDGGEYVTTGVTRYYDMDTSATLPWTGTTMTIRVTASNELGQSSAATIEL
ncbi:hypothetical protein ABIB35_001482 [Arthrobacter sp. UYP6]|uniref:sialate O-acetylesterase n=1 Tax=Arthrobacter sp. UYP6 TaxID=1756378 RepID=UPI00339707D3